MSELLKSPEADSGTGTFQGLFDELGAVQPDLAVPCAVVDEKRHPAAGASRKSRSCPWKKPAREHHTASKAPWVPHCCLQRTGCPLREAADDHTFRWHAIVALQLAHAAVHSGRRGRAVPCNVWILMVRGSYMHAIRTEDVGPSL